MKDAWFFDWVCVLLLVMGFSFVADWRRLHPEQSIWLKHDQSDHIGAEYDTIARAIRTGRGFSDPFHEPTGPTAWMPPVLVYFTTALYWITGDNRLMVMEVIVACNMLVMVAVGGLVVGQSRRLGYPKLGMMTLATFYAADFFELFQMTHDTWLILLMLAVMWIGAVHQFDGPQSIRSTVTWGWLGGLFALSSPVLGFCFAMITIVMWLPKRAYVAIGIAGLASILVVTPWMVRNRVMLGKWIPVKSNAVYEIWQSQVLDDDGVLDIHCLRQHPWSSNGEQRQEYREKGEIKFIACRWPPTAASISSDPLGFLQRVVNRWFAACWIYTPLAASDEMMWPMISFKRLFFPLPILAAGMILILGRWPMDKHVKLTLWLYGLYLAPYIAISYYDRYAAPAVFLKILLVVMAFATVVQRFGRDQPALDARPAVRCGFTLVELLVVLSIIGLLISLAGPAVQRARESALRLECQNRIRQTALGLELFHTSHKHLPSNGGPALGSTLKLVGGPDVQPYTDDLADGMHYVWGVGDPARTGKPQTGSWAYSILPFVEQEAAYQQGRCDTVQPLFACPSRPRGTPVAPIDSELARYQSGGIAMTKTDFCANNRVVPNLPEVKRHADILDGLSQTIVIGEKAFDPVVQTDAAWYWDEPIWIGGSKGTARSGLKVLPDRRGIEYKENWGSPHDGGALFAFADGHVQFVTHSVDWQLLSASLSPRGGEAKTIAE